MAPSQHEGGLASVARENLDRQWCRVFAAARASFESPSQEVLFSGEAVIVGRGRQLESAECFAQNLLPTNQRLWTDPRPLGRH